MSLLPLPLLCLAPAWAQVPAGEVAAPFQDLDFETAAARATEAGRILLVALVAADSEDCRRMAAETWTAEDAVRWIEAEAVAIALDASAHAELVLRYEVGVIPSVLWLDGDGAELGRLEGFAPPGRFIRAGGAALELRRSTVDLCGRLAASPDDPELWLALARACAGVPARALQAFDEAWRLGRDVPSFAHLRLGPVLTEVAALAQRYAPAKKALVRWRNAALEGLADPTAPEALRSAVDFSAINRARDDARSTAEQYERLRADPAAPREVLELLFDHQVAGLYYAEKRYAELLEGLGDVFVRTELAFAELEAERAKERASPPPPGEKRYPGPASGIYGRTGMYLEVLLQVGRENGGREDGGRGDEARELVDFVLLREPAAGAYVALWRGAKKGGAPELAAEIHERGLAELAGRELAEFKSQIERAQGDRER